MRIVLALGGNALLRRGEPMTAAIQRANVRRAAAALAPLCSPDNEIIVTHGNGPQVGLLALQSAAGPPDGRFPLDLLSAESEGLLGYLIEQELRNALPAERPVASLLTQVVVDPDDPAFLQPTKPIGPVYSEAEARQLAKEKGWTVREDGRHWRRVVPSPRPQLILEQSVISLLAAEGVVVICIGGGGIPVARDAERQLTGVEAVIDKDLASALLAEKIGADALLLLTDVDSVYLGWPGAGRQSIALAGPGALEPMDFEAGSMRPKIEAATGFVRRTGRCAAIGRLEDAKHILANQAGTTFDPSHHGRRLRQ